ncbi:MAG: hypothetical protein ABI981_04575 [Betaproteobacteria bacterium]
MDRSEAPPTTDHGPWSPGIRSQVPRDLLHLSTIFREENVFTRVSDAEEWRDLTGFELADLVAFRPQRLALHELLIRVTANFSVPDGARIEDLGINFRHIIATLLERCVAPHVEAIEGAYSAARARITTTVDLELTRLLHPPPPSPPPRGGLLRLLLGGPAPDEEVETDAAREQRVLAEWERKAGAGEDRFEKAVHHALLHVVSALRVRHGHAWGGHELIGRLVTAQACNDFAGEEIGRMLDPWLASAARAEGYTMLPRQPEPVVMNTKGASASGKSTLRPMQKALAGQIGVRWSEFALISPDIWRKQLLDCGSLATAYKYGGAFTGDEVRIIDQKLDRYMAAKAACGEMSHLLIDRFRFDSFAPDSSEAGSNLLTRFGHVVYLFFMITPPESLVERAWRRGLEVGRYKAVDDTLAHCIDAYSGIPELFFTWIRRGDKRLRFEFLDNSVALGERPRTVAFGSNEVLNILDVGRMLDIERFRRVDVDATSPSSLFADRRAQEAARNTGFLVRCAALFDEVVFADQQSGRVYLRLRRHAPAWIDETALAHALTDADTRAGIAALGIDPQRPPPGTLLAAAPVRLAEAMGDVPGDTLGAWAGNRQADPGS